MIYYSKIKNGTIVLISLQADVDFKELTPRLDSKLIRCCTTHTRRHRTEIRLWIHRLPKIKVSFIHREDVIGYFKDLGDDMSFMLIGDNGLPLCTEDIISVTKISEYIS